MAAGELASLGTPRGVAFQQIDAATDQPLGQRHAIMASAAVGPSLETLYVETSIVSYLRGRPSSQVVAAARQLLTQRWWGAERANYELVTSQYVLD
ncbi:MAG: hypothetical protein EBX35_01765, partial [Planctomycetia bacterium]|nr:hypothetical protein [Planctomycetia bacterium]